MPNITNAFGKGIGLSSMLGSQDAFIKKATEQLELSKIETKDKTEIRETKLGEISQLQKILTTIKGKASLLTNPLQAGFDRKTSSTSTQDLGGAEDYITNIRVADKARTGDTKIAVQQIATASELVLASGAGVGFAKGVGLGKDGIMTLTVGGQARAIDMVVGDTVEQIAAKINHAFTAGGDQFEAFLVEGDGNTAFIEVKAKNTGVGGGAIAVAYDDRLGGVALAAGGNLHSQSNVAGQDAIIHINGIQRTKASNKFVNVVDGLSFELSGRENAVNAAPGNVMHGGRSYNTIKVKEDHANVKKMIVDFGNSLNDLSYIIAKNQQTTRSVTQDKYADPTQLMSSYDSSDSPLRGSPLMNEAMEIWERFTTTKAGGAGDITSIYELGMGLQKATKEGVSHDTLYFEDESIFTKKFDDDFAAVRRFFVTDTKITSHPANLATLQYLPGEFDKQIIDPSVVGQNITTDATFDAGGVLTVFTATVNGVVLNADIVHNPGTGRYNVSFAEGLSLHWMEFSIDPKTAVNVVEHNVINYTPGLANLIQEDARSMVSDDGLKGSTISEADLIQEQVKNLSDESAKIEKDLKEFTAKLEREYQTIAQMDMMGAIQTAMIEAALSGLTASAA
jgi:flagellar capping protein FliD